MGTLLLSPNGAGSKGALRTAATCRAREAACGGQGRRNRHICLPAPSFLQAAARLQQRRRKLREQVTVGRARHQASLTSPGSCLAQTTPLAALSGPCLPCPSTQPSSASCPLSLADPTAPHTPPGQRIEMAVAAVHLLPTMCHHVPAFTHITSLHPYTSPSQQASLRLSFRWRSRPSEVSNLARSHPGNDGARMGTTHSPGRSLTSGHL